MLLFDAIDSQLGGDGTVLYTSWLFQRVVPPVASFSLGSLGFLTPFDFTNFHHTLAESFDRGVTARLRMRFECTIMRMVENSESSSEDTDRSEMLEMHFEAKPKKKPEGNNVNHHTEEYWKSSGQPIGPVKSRANRGREDEWLHTGHRASESFSVLNELVVVSHGSQIGIDHRIGDRIRSCLLWSYMVMTNISRVLLQMAWSLLPLLDQPLTAYSL
jgi:ATP-NAD kinase N-terminal domain